MSKSNNIKSSNNNNSAYGWRSWHGCVLVLAKSMSRASTRSCGPQLHTKYQPEFRRSAV